jgi:hypothetical protein
MKTTMIQKLAELIDMNITALNGGDDGCYILGDSLDDWGPANEPGFVLPDKAERLLKLGKLCVILANGEYEYCSPARALEWMQEFDSRK